MILLILLQPAHRQNMQDFRNAIVKPSNHSDDMKFMVAQTEAFGSL